ncbi:hypothetical protein D9756_006321 [Leucocoprinus leucothites]|uniref:Uncharacterized protein n=1 Tax=Leucocoprinus leucothites TaxID=201217 RepID=A0A8H5D5Z9_9AGAR|nr:hypothetical protein D9756_006321 [Leucoagaricus leucothites]
MHYSPVFHLFSIAILSARSISIFPTVELTAAPLVGHGGSIESTLNARKNDSHVSKSYKLAIKVSQDGHIPVSYKPAIKFYMHELSCISMVGLRTIIYSKLEIYYAWSFDLVERGVVKLIKDKVRQDNHAREKFTKETVANGRKKFPHSNWGHSHHEVDIPVGGTVGYEIYWFRGIYFHKRGDGGFTNWAYSGFTGSVSTDGSKGVFKRPP